MDVKPTLTLDFDGVIHTYAHGWQGGKISDPQPAIGTRGAMERLANKYRLAVTTARTDLGPVRQALKDWGLDHLVAEVGNKKTPSVAYIDDKGIQHRNWDETIAELQRMTGEQV